jgi:predicted  nucleic acid-binding Zn-ribbon protein
VHSHLVLVQSHDGSVLSKILPEIFEVFSADDVKFEFLSNADLDSLINGGGQAFKTPCVVFYDTAIQAVERAVLQGTFPREALAQWEENTSRLLALYRKHRRQMVLANGLTTCLAPQAFVTALESRLGLHSEKTVDLPSQELETGVVEKLIAIQTVAQSPSAKRLDGELEASALPLLIEENSCDVDVAFATYQRGKENPEQKEETNLLAIQLECAQEELETLDAKEKDLEHQLCVARDEIIKLTEGLKAAEKENEHLLLQLHDIQAEFEVAVKQAQNDKQALNDRVAGLEKTLAETKKQAVERSRQQLAEAVELKETAEKENQRLLLQLSNVQEELEVYFQEMKMLQQKLQETETHSGSLQAKLDKSISREHVAELEKRLQEAEHNLKVSEDTLKQRDHEAEIFRQHQAHLQAELDLRTNELHELLSSTSWRATGPLRHLKDRLSPRGDR